MSQLVRIGVCRLIERFALLAVCLGLAIPAGCRREESPQEKVPARTEEIAKPEETPQDETKATSGREVFNRMIIAYREATTYADAGEVRLTVEADGETIHDETANYSLTLEDPNKIRVQAHQAMLVCNGKNLYASIEDLPDQVLVRRAPIRISMKTLYFDRILAMALTQGIGGPMPQPTLLLADEPIKALLRDDEKPELLESDKIDGRDCYRVQVKWPEGAATFWVDQETFVLRRIVLPTEEIRRAIVFI